jgi:glycerophosphoryl diester phosphodiesterase
MDQSSYIFAFNVCTDGKPSLTLFGEDPPLSSYTFLFQNDMRAIATVYSHIIVPCVESFSIVRVLDPDDSLVGIAYIVIPRGGLTMAKEANTPVINDKTGTIRGSLTFSVLPLSPFVHPNNAPNGIHDTHPEGITIIGHRGFGAVSHNVNAPSAQQGRSKPRENTMASFLAAVKSGAVAVEFDVQLTRDYIPTIFHDFDVNIRITDRSTVLDEIVSVPFASLTYRQLNSLRITENRVRTLKSLVLKHWGSIVMKKKRAGSSFIPMNMHVANITDEIPTYMRVLREVPEHVVFDVEVKYPVFECETRLKMIPTNRDINLYVDKILRITFDHAGSRKLVFTSFSPDICVLLSEKQNRYSVMFLTEAPLTQRIDMRCTTLRYAIQFTQFSKLRGIVCNSRAFKADPSIIQEAKEGGRSLWTYGSLNNRDSWATWQYKQGIKTVIADFTTGQPLQKEVLT